MRSAADSAPTPACVAAQINWLIDQAPDELDEHGTFWESCVSSFVGGGPGEPAAESGPLCRECDAIVTAWQGHL